MLAGAEPAPRPKPKPEPPAPPPGCGGGSGNRSPQAGKLDASRAWVLELAPWFAAALNDGLITPEHVGALGVALRRLGARDQAKLLALDAEISAAAASQIPKELGVTLQGLADRVTGAVPQDRIGQQRRRSGRLYVNADGMGCAYLQTDTDTHAVIEAVIETEVLRRLREQRHPDTTPDQLRADVIADLLRRTTTSGTTAGLLVITEPHTEPATANPAILNGRPVTAAAQRILCDAGPGLSGSVPEAPAAGACPMTAR